MESNQQSTITKIRNQQSAIAKSAINNQQSAIPTAIRARFAPRP
jgi:hypothetical protein